jgi:ribosomal protein S18 acetylase RimI-like enzyme
MKPFERNALNLLESLSFYGHATGRGRVETTTGVKLIASGVSYSVFNIALLTGPVADIDGELERRIHVAGAFFRDLGAPWSFWICEDFLGRRTARKAHQLFDRQGMVCIAESPGMEAWPLPPPRRALPEIECRRVGDEATRADFAHLVSTSFQVPYPLATEIYTREAAWNGSLEGYVGYVGEKAVSSAALIEAGGVVGLYSVSTLPAWRRKGFGEALMHGALAAKPPTSAIVLQSSRAGLRLYYEMGFRRVTRFFVYAIP